MKKKQSKKASRERSQAFKELLQENSELLIYNLDLGLKVAAIEMLFKEHAVITRGDYEGKVKELEREIQEKTLEEYGEIPEGVKEMKQRLLGRNYD